MIRYFFAAFPSPDESAECLARARALAAKLDLHGKFTPPEKLHTTLAFLATCVSPEAEREQRAHYAGSFLRAAVTSITFDVAEDFGHGGGSRPYVFAASVVPDDLASLATALAEQSGEPMTRPFRPHVTWMYGKNAIATPIPVRILPWQIRSVQLVRSDGGRYTILGTWPLR